MDLAESRFRAARGVVPATDIIRADGFRALPNGAANLTDIKRRLGFLTVMIVAVLLQAAWAVGQPAAEPLAPGDYSFSLEHGGQDRSYLVHVPPQAGSRKPLPVVLNFHGAMSNGHQQERYSGMDGAADHFGFIAVYPNGTGRRGHLSWNAGLCCAYAMFHREDDVGYVRALFDDLSTRTAIDHTRIYATGISNGAMMSYRLAVEASDLIAAIAPVAGALVLREFRPTRPMAIMHIHSVDDPFARYHGGYGAFGKLGRNMGNPDVEQMLARWRAFDKCPDRPRTGPVLNGSLGTSDAGNSATKYAWGPCSEGTEIVLWKLTGSGHVWPGASSQARFLGRSTGLFDANQEIWRFFIKFPLRQNK
jgi:polyhydroxybutyrate depolymerase